MLKKCTRCILPESYPGIRFNEQGVCDSCLTHEKVQYRGEAELLKLVESLRNSGSEYDGIVALSGGRDSAFAAYYAVRFLNLRILAYNYDNGFMPEQTKENVKNIVDLLNIDLITDKNNHMKKNAKHIISCWVRNPSPGMVAVLCTGCQIGYQRGLVKTAKKYRIPMIILGSGEPEPEQSFAKKLLSFSPNIKRRRLSLILGFMRETMRNPYYVLSPTYLTAFAREYFYRFVYKTDMRRGVPIFEFIEWNEEKIMSVITNELRWEKPPHSRSSWRADCNIHLLRQYLYKETLGFTKNEELLSGMIRENMITREESLKRAEYENVISEQFLTALFDELGINFPDLVIALSGYQKTKPDIWQTASTDQLEFEHYRF